MNNMPDTLITYVVRWIFAVAAMVFWVLAASAFIHGQQPFAIIAAFFALIVTIAWGIMQAARL